MNDTVNVTGMRVKTQVSDNLFITSDTLDNTATITTDSLYKNSLIGASTAVTLEPVSTTDGKAFWYTATNNVKSTGDADSEVYIAYDLTTDTDTTDSFDNDFEANYKVSDAVGYVDYIFQLKAINTSSSASYVILDQLDLTYGSATNASKAFRVAIFAEALTSVNNLTNATTSRTWSGLTSATALIYTPASAENFTAGQAVKTASTLDTVTYVSSAASSKWEVAANTTQYF